MKWNSIISEVQLFWSRLESDGTTFFDSLFKIALRVGILIAGYVVWDKVLMGASRLPVESYEESFIFWEFLTHLFKTKFGIPLLVLLGFLVVFRKGLMHSWIVLEQGKEIRILVCVASGILAWMFATYDLNLYVNQAHYADRLLLLLCVPLIWWRPVFVLPFLSIVLPVIWQFPLLIGYSWAAPFISIRILILFITCFSLFLVIKKFPLRDFVLIAGSLYAAHYWLPGWGKFTWEWIQHDQLFFILPAAYSNGWLKFLDSSTIVSILETLAPLNTLMKILVLGLELGAFFFFVHPKSPRIFLVGWILMHTGIFLCTGIGLWMWVLMDATLLILFLRKGSFSQLSLFSRPHFIISAILILGCTLWFRPIEIAWYDVPFSYSYQVKAITVEDEIIDLPPSFFTPYAYQIIMSGLYYLAPHPMLHTHDRLQDKEWPIQLMSIKTKEEFFELEKSKGAVSFDVEQAAFFNTLVKKYVSHWNERQAKGTLFSYFRAPNLLWNYTQELPFENPVQIKQITIIQTTALFPYGDYAEIRSIPVYEVYIP